MNLLRRLVVRLAPVPFLSFLAAGCAHAGAGGKGAAAAPEGESAAAKPALPCTVESKSDDVGAYTCGEVTGMVATSKATAKVALDQYVKETEKALKGSGKLRRATVKLEDLDVPGLKVTVDWKGGAKPPTDTFVWAIPLKGETGLVTCMSQGGSVTLDQCHTAFIDLMKTLSAMDDSGSSDDAGKATSDDTKLFGKDVKVADGCKTTRVNAQMMALDCGPAKLMWNDFGKSDTTEGFLDGVEHETRAKFKGSTRSESACTIDGRATSCRRIAASVEGKKLVFYFGLSQYEGHAMLVECVYEGDGASPPAPCNDVIASKKH